MSPRSFRETQPARTVLAWQRTALAAVAATVALARLDWWRVEWLAIPTILVVALAATVAAIPVRRLGRQGTARATSGAPHTALTVAILAIAVTEAVAVTR